MTFPRFLHAALVTSMLCAGCSAHHDDISVERCPGGTVSSLRIDLGAVGTASAALRLGDGTLFVAGGRTRTLPATSERPVNLQNGAFGYRFDADGAPISRVDASLFPEASIVPGEEIVDLIEQRPAVVVGLGCVDDLGQPDHRPAFLVRFDGDALDSEFGARGVATAELGDRPDFDCARSVVMLRDGSFVVPLARHSESPPAGNVSLAHFDRDGHWLELRALPGTLPGGDVTATLDGEGRMVLAAGASAVARVLPDLSLDPTFGDGGVTPPRLGIHCSSFSDARCAEPTVLDDGSIYVVGNATDATSDKLAVLGLAPDGAPLRGFGVDGVLSVTSPLPALTGSAVGAWRGPSGDLVLVVASWGGSLGWGFRWARVTDASPSAWRTVAPTGFYVVRVVQDERGLPLAVGGMTNTTGTKIDPGVVGVCGSD